MARLKLEDQLYERMLAQRDRYHTCLVALDLCLKNAIADHCWHRTGASWDALLEARGLIGQVLKENPDNGR